jgi:hypothetical protein
MATKSSGTITKSSGARTKSSGTRTVSSGTRSKSLETRANSSGTGKNSSGTTSNRLEPVAKWLDAGKRSSEPGVGAPVSDPACFFHKQPKQVSKDSGRTKNAEGKCLSAPNLWGRSGRFPNGHAGSETGAPREGGGVFSEEFKNPLAYNSHSIYYLYCILRKPSTHRSSVGVEFASETPARV